MPTSEPTQAYAWIWLPGESDPVVAGLLSTQGDVIAFNYGESYLARDNAISIFTPELPLSPGVKIPSVGPIAGCIADAGPDSWGQRIILWNRLGRNLTDADDLGELTFLLESGSNRIGALDFQASPTNYVPHSTLAELAEAAALLEAGKTLSPSLESALLNGTAIGGARPKALLRDGERHLIAKFSSSTDVSPMMKWEYVAMDLARRAGLSVAPVEMRQALGRDALIVERFDRPGGGLRRSMVSALTILELIPMTARYATYYDLAFQIRSLGVAPIDDTHELFSRISFNILVGNNDDHARNHAAFWDGTNLELTPAYDIAPQPRSGGETAQAMDIGPNFRMSQLAGLVDRADAYLLSQDEAREIVDHQIEVIRADWDEVCDIARLTEIERSELWGRQFLNPYAFEGYSPGLRKASPRPDISTRAASGHQPRVPRGSRSGGEFAPKMNSEAQIDLS
jgi:serine/threonine-protein kinase HipA